MRTALNPYAPRRTRAPIIAILSLILVVCFVFTFQPGPENLQPENFGGIVPTSPFDIFAPNDVYTSSNYTWITRNQRAIHALLRCIELRDCGPNQHKVVLISSHDFISPLQGGYIGGEAVWAMSTLRAVENLGYTPLFTSSIEAALNIHNLFGNLIKVVLATPEQIHYCHHHAPCIKTVENPAGIPSWKFLSQHFWVAGADINPLGPKWTLSPEDYHASTTYLGYSIEPQCAKYPFIPYSQRTEKQVYILAKFLKFFHPASSPAWSSELFDAAASETGVRFIMAARHLPEETEEQKARSRQGVAKSIENVSAGRLRGEVPTQEQFYGMLGRSVALVGMGNPVLSPTPYDALCLGVPFINPILQWDRANPSDRTKWRTQHDALKDLSAPYVYHARVGDRDGFVSAIRAAKENPIESYVPERMRIKSVEERMGRIVEWDWKKEAEMVMRAREERGEAPLPLLL